MAEFNLFAEHVGNAERTPQTRPLTPASGGFPYQAEPVRTATWSPLPTGTVVVTNSGRWSNSFR